jgi:deoxyribose-phosphate aldolase
MLQPYYIETARRCLKESRLKIIAMIGSPHGGTSAATKMFETQDAQQRGAMRSPWLSTFMPCVIVKTCLFRMTSPLSCRPRGRPVTVILENFLSVEEKTRACRIADKARVSFIQTSLGATDHEITLANVKIMSVASKIPVVASGKIDTPAHAAALIQAGAARVATGDTERILS